jgi:hypothetical protein
MTSSSIRGTRRSFPKHRQTVLEILRHSQRIPSFPILRHMNLADLAHVRSACSARIGWTTLFGRAYAQVCQSMPELIDLFVSYPTKHLYRHPHSVASISIHRKDQNGNNRLIWGRWGNPESTGLVELQKQLDVFCQAPMSEAYREGLILERSPAFARRFVWWCTMNCSGRKRAKHVGTFSISSLGGMGALNLHHPLMTSSSLAFGPLDANGKMDVVLICDHRVIDGILAAEALASLERMLCTTICEELSH